MQGQISIFFAFSEMRKARAPTVSETAVIFDHSTPDNSQKIDLNALKKDKQSYKLFMSSKISKLSSTPALIDPKSISEEAQADRDDKALQDLLHSSQLLRSVIADSQTGRELRKSNQDQIAALGGDFHRQKISLKMHIGMAAAATERVKAAVTTLRDTGIYTKSSAR